MDKRIFLLVIIVLALCSCGDGRGDSEDETAVVQDLSAVDYGLELSLPFVPTQSHYLTRAYSPTADDTVVWTHKNKDKYALDMARNGSDVRILSAHSGTVISAGVYGGYGYRVLLRHDETGLVSHYAHMRDNSLQVKTGDNIARGTFIGLEGGTPHWGQHLHFALYSGNDESDFVPVLAEPIGGYEDMQSLVGARLGSGYSILPIGTVVKEYDKPEIYVVCGEARICHIKDWDTFRTMRFFHDYMEPLAQVIELTADDIGCYTRGPEISGLSQRKLMTCGGVDYLYISENGQSIKLSIPFDKRTQTALYDRLLKSWGFSQDELTEGTKVECTVRNGGRLNLRDGTILELTSDNDFYVVSADMWESEANPTVGHGYVMRLHRERDGKPFMPLLYRSFDNVILLPESAIFEMTAGMRSDKRVFTPEMAEQCNEQSGPAGGSDDTADQEGVEESQETVPTGECTEGARRCADFHNYSACVMDWSGGVGVGHWETWPCPPEWGCSESTGMCDVAIAAGEPPAEEGSAEVGTGGAPSAGEGTGGTGPEGVSAEGPAAAPEVGSGGSGGSTPEPSPASGGAGGHPEAPSVEGDGEAGAAQGQPAEPEAPAVPSVDCVIGGDVQITTLSGPLVGSGALVEDPADPASVCIASDRTGWTAFDACLPVAGDAASYAFTTPVLDAGFTFVALDGEGGYTDGTWLDARPGTPVVVTGGCVMGDGLVLIGESDVAANPEPTPEPEPEPPPATGEPAAPEPPPHVISCEPADGGTRVTLYGPLLDGVALMEAPESPSGISFGSNQCYGWAAEEKFGDWLADADAQEIVLPPCVTSFNVRILDAADPGRDSWLRLCAADGSPWSVIGACSMGDGLVLVD